MYAFNLLCVVEISLYRLITLKYQKFHIKPSIYLLFHSIISIVAILLGSLVSVYFLLDKQVGRNAALAFWIMENL